MAASHAAKNQRDTIAPLRRHQKTAKPLDPSPTIFIGSPLTTAGTAPVLFVEDDSRKKGCIAPLPVICYSAGMNNAIALAKKLEREHGFNQPQAEGIAQAIHDHESEHLATKADLARLEAKLDKLEAKLDTRLAQMDSKLETSLAQMDTKLETSLAQMDTRFAQMETRFAQMDTKLETGLAQMDTKLETSLAQMDTKLAQLQVRLMTWTTVLAGIIIAVLKFT